MNIYSNLKAAWHLDKIKEMRDGGIPVPSQVQLIISDLCNQDCNFCAYRSSNGFSTEQFAINGNSNPNRKIPTDKCLEILDDCKSMGVEAIQFTGGGEPTVHPDHLEIFEYAQGLGFKTGLVTNGVKLKPHKVYDNFDWIRISVDAGEEETYRKIRAHNGFKKVWDNIKILTETAKGIIGIGYVITIDNWQEIHRATMAANKSGASYIRFSAVFSELGSDSYKYIHDDILKELLMVSPYVNSRFSIYDLYGDRLKDLDQGKPDYKYCGYQYFNCYIGGNQKVYRCCTTAYTKHGEVGDLSNMRFKDFMETRIDDLDARSCHTCQFNEKNRVIDYLVSEPEHVEFV